MGALFEPAAPLSGAPGCWAVLGEGAAVGLVAPALGGVSEIGRELGLLLILPTVGAAPVAGVPVGEPLPGTTCVVTPVVEVTAVEVWPCMTAAGLGAEVVVPPAAAVLPTGAATTDVAGESRPITGTAPRAVWIVPPMSATAICCAVAVAMPLLMSDWRAASSVRAVWVISSVPPLALNVTSCVGPSGNVVLSVTGTPSARPLTRLSKLVCEPAKATSCGAIPETSCDGGRDTTVEVCAHAGSWERITAAVVAAGARPGIGGTPFGPRAGKGDPAAAQASFRRFLALPPGIF